MSHHARHRLRQALTACLGLLLLSVVATPASAEVHQTGEWPSEDERVSINFQGTRAEALRQLAQKAGWSVIDSPGDGDLSRASATVNLYVTDQPAVKVLESLLGDGDYQVRRDGKLLYIARAGAPTSASSASSALGRVAELPPPTAPAGSDPQGAQQAQAPSRTRDAKDRTVFGRSATIARDEGVQNLTVMGGSADLYGTVEQDVLVLGGSLDIHGGAHVQGDVSVLGGSVNLADGARVDGDLSAAGGDIDRAAGAIVKGDEVALLDGDSGDDDDRADERKPVEDDEDDSTDEREDESWSFVASARKLGGALSRAALLYAFGCVLLAAAGRHMKLMQTELAERPVRAFGLGLATLIAGAMALIALIVTIIGIPVAILAVLVGTLGVYAGMCAVFLEVGALMLEERTPSPYAHLALGCLIYLIFSALPVIGWIATVAAGVFGLGLLASALVTRLFGHSQAGTAAT